jgi:hypothetical protein
MKLIMVSLGLACLGVGHFEQTPIMFVPVAVCLGGLFIMELADRLNRT